VAIAGIAAAGLLAGSGPVFLVGLGLGAAHLGWQIATLDVNDGDNCLKRFRSNRDFGAIIFIALVAEAALRV